MRAGVLSDDQIIEFLNENFINTWVPNSELGRVPSLRDPIAKRRERESKTFDTTHVLAQAIMKGWKTHSPVDCLVISPAFELMGRQSVNEFLSGGDWQRRYVMFLQDSLAGKLPGFGEDTSEPEPLNSDTVLSSLNVVLNDVRSSQEVLNIFRTPEPGYQDYTVVEIDATAFENGGVLTIDISVGHAEAAGSFDLFAGDSKLPTEGVPHGALASAWGISPGETNRIIYTFDRGQSFRFGATGDWFSKKGSTNAFLATISVEGVNLSLHSATDKISMENTLDKKATLQVRAYWKPIADAALGLPNYSPENAALFNNLSPAHPSQEYEAATFEAFFPKEDVAVGDLWELDVNGVIPFLQQFHPGATAEMHLNPRGWTYVDDRRVVVGMESDGGFACLRALSSNYAEIVFRVHAEFLLDKDAPAYFTPAQFTGRLVLNRNSGTIREFWLYLPPRNTNVDINAFNAADMVFVPRMELIGQNADDQSDIVWETTITEENGKAMLAAAFYKSAEIERFPIEEVIEQAQAKNRPIHVLMTWGVFDDESC